MRALVAVLVLSVLAPLALAGEPDLDQEIAAYLADASNFETRSPMLCAIAPTGEDWAFETALYLWAAGVKGDLSAGGVTVPVDVGFDDLFDQLDGAFMLHANARKGRWGGFLDFAWISLEADTTGLLGQPASADSNLFFVELAVSYLALDRPIDSDARLLVDVYGGARIYAADNDLVVDSVPRSQDSDWVDPILGFDAMVLTGKWGFGVRADIGGFGAGSDLSWSVLLGAQYRFSELFSLALGYRWLDIDYSTGSGPDTFALDILMSGPFLAFAFSF